MNQPRSFLRHTWIPVLLLATGFVLWAGQRRMARVEFVTTSVPADVVPAPASPTGYAGGARALVLPESNNDAAQWVIQTQQMLAAKEWRIRRIDYENAPYGRDLTSPSPYRWWLGFVAWLEQVLAGKSPGRSVEAAALHADPLLHVAGLIGLTLFIRWRFGAGAASTAAIALAALFPFAAGFLPGAPDDHGLAQLVVLASLLSLAVGFSAPGESADAAILARNQRRWFFTAGVLGGLGLWVSARHEAPLLAGVALGALLAAWLRRTDSGAAPLPWLAWALGGATTSLLAYLAEYYPDHLGGWQLRDIHPLYSLAWIGLGLLLHTMTPWLQRQAVRWNAARITLLALAVVALIALPIAMARTGNRGFLSTEASSFKLTRLIGGAEASNFWGWLGYDGLTAALGATLLPVLLLLPVGGLLLGKKLPLNLRSGLAIALGPVAVALVFACWQLSWWGFFDLALLALLVPAIAAAGTLAISAAWRWSYWSLLLAAVLLGLPQLRPSASQAELEAPELSGLIQRDLALWLAKRVGPHKAIVLAPPSETTAFSYYGGLPGVGSLSPDNQEGITAAVRILSATTPQEAQALIARRGVTHIVIPSWDSYLNEYVRAGSAQVENTFLGGLRNWALPAWLRPVAYQMPSVPGYEGQSVAVFEVVEEQGEAASLGQLAVYFVEAGRLDYATAIGRDLQRFPADLGALAARAEVQVARGDEAALAETMRSLLPKLASGADRPLSWERRAGLVVVLARLKQPELASAQLRRCFAEMTEARLRALSTGALYRLLAVGKIYGVAIPDPQLRALALDLMPAESRDRL
jgi:hypothetical protein